MPLIVADCPRCSAEKMTFDISGQVYLGMAHSWQTFHEVFSICRGCNRPTIFLIELSLRGRSTDLSQSEKFTDQPEKILNFENSLNPYFDVVRPIMLRDFASIKPPEHLPNDLKCVFEEGAACFAIGSYNAAACMFRLCLDLVSKPLLPDPNDENTERPNSQQRRNLGPRLNWLFDTKQIPDALRKLADCIRDDGNDGAHAGNLKKEDAEDILDFTIALLERLITEPKKLEIAEERHKARRKQT